jgi:acetoin utilization protein AcuB
MRKTTPVADHMSRLPEEIDRRTPLATVARRMRELEIRHMPVLDGPRIFGVLSEHDALEAWRRHGAHAGGMPVGDVCTREPLVVAPTDSVPAVAQRMVSRGVTSALVADGGVLVGIFTGVDALRILSKL